MDIQQSHRRYEALGSALRQVLQIFDPKAPVERVRQKVEEALALGEQIGEPLQKDVEALRIAFHRMMKKPGDLHLMEAFLKQAFRLEQQTREI